MGPPTFSRSAAARRLELPSRYRCCWNTRRCSSAKPTQKPAPGCGSALLGRKPLQPLLASAPIGVHAHRTEAEQRAEQAGRRAEQERLRAGRLAEWLRARRIDPDATD